MENYILYISFALSVLSIIFFFILNIRLNGLIKKYNYFMQGLGEKDVEKLMTSYLEKLERLKNDVNISMNKRIETIERKIPHCLQHVGVVKYNAFENVGNEMSFSIAAMDERKNGFIVTGIYARESSYVYAKEIRKGKPLKELSIEELEAMNKALDKFETLR